MTEVIYRERRRRYHWPEAQLNLWLIIILAAAATCLGIFAWFMAVQHQMRLGTPWLVSTPPNIAPYGEANYHFLLLGSSPTWSPFPHSPSSSG